MQTWLYISRYNRLPSLVTPVRKQLFLAAIHGASQTTSIKNVHWGFHQSLFLPSHSLGWEGVDGGFVQSTAQHFVNVNLNIMCITLPLMTSRSIYPHHCNICHVLSIISQRRQPLRLCHWSPGKRLQMWSRPYSLSFLQFMQFPLLLLVVKNLEATEIRGSCDSFAVWSLFHSCIFLWTTVGKWVWVSDCQNGISHVSVTHDHDYMDISIWGCALPPQTLNRA